MANFFDQFDGPRPGPTVEAAAAAKGPTLDAAARKNFFDQFDVPAPPPVGIGEDIAKAAGSGLAEGAIGVIGLPGDIQQGAGWLAGKAAALLGGSEENVKNAVRRGFGLGTIPHSEDVAAGVKNVTGFEPYKPQTTAGKFVRTAAEFVPGAVALGGPSIAKNAIKYGVLPGAASEAAGSAPGIAGTKFEPYARVAGGITAAGGAGIRDASKARSAAKATVATVEDTKAAAKTLYDAVDNSGVVIEPARFSALVDGIAADLHKVGLDPDLHKRASAALARLEKTKGVAPTLSDLEILRRVAGQAAKSTEPSDVFMSGQIIEKLDDFMDGLKPSDVISAGDPAAAIAAVKEARALWHQKAKAQKVEALVEAAELRASQFSGSGLENAIRTEFRNFAKNPRNLRGFTDDEKAAIFRVVKGGPLDNVARFIGKAAPTGIVPAAGGAYIGGTLAGGAGGLGTAGLFGAGLVGRRAATNMTKDNAAIVDALILSRGNLPAGLDTPLVRALTLPAVREGAIYGGLPERDRLTARPAR